MTQTTAILAAAGSGQRLGAGGPKALAELAGRPMYEWSLEALSAAGSVGAVVIAAPPGHEGSFARDGVDVVAGGAERSDSVAAALERVGTGVVAIHDAARPLATPGLVDALVARLDEEPDAAGVIAAAPVTDTIKIADERLAIAETPDRRFLWAAQTPQVFRVAELREALADPDARAAATDEASLVERYGGTVLLHAVKAPNLKVTTATDLKVAEMLLAQRG